MGFNIEVMEINNREALALKVKELGMRHDWHEPDEQGVTALVAGKNFDNAGVEGEINILIMQEGKPIFTINLATLFAFAVGHYAGEV